MANFIVRVVLHGAENDREAYTKLHESMEAAYYYRTVDGIVENTGASTTVELPPATYRAAGTPAATAATIRNHVRLIVNQTGFKNSVFVVQYTSSAWVGL